MDTRRFDLEDLGEAINRAKSKNEREHYEKLMWRIMGESQPIRALREDLLGAVRVSDYRAVKRIREHIQKIRLDETNGHSWGQDKAERKAFS